MKEFFELLQGSEGYNLNNTIYDPWANPDIVKHEYGIDVTANLSSLTANHYDACIAAVAHKKFEGLDILGLLKEKHVVFDVKCTLDRSLVDGRL